VSEIEEMPEVVYHYATMDVLLKIIETRELWATSIKYLNDVSEHSLLVQAAREHVEEFAKEHEGANFSHFFEHEYNESEHDVSFIDLPFVTSFSREGDSLTHWRSYCTAGNGVSIGFSTTCLLKAEVRTPVKPLAGMLIPRPVFGRVDYIDPNDKQKMKDVLERAYNYAKLRTSDSNRTQYFQRNLEDEFFGEILNTAGFYKSVSFRDEREYRLLVADIDYRQDLLQFRTSRSSLIPYTPLIIPSHDGDSKFKSWDAIVSITVGPTPNMNLSLDSLSTLCRYQGMKSHICDSKVACRDW
jgi:hypothetical protein